MVPVPPQTAQARFPVPVHSLHSTTKNPTNCFPVPPHLPQGTLFSPRQPEHSRIRILPSLQHVHYIRLFPNPIALPRRRHRTWLPARSTRHAGTAITGQSWARTPGPTTLAHNRRQFRSKIRDHRHRRHRQPCMSPQGLPLGSISCCCFAKAGR